MASTTRRWLRKKTFTEDELQTTNLRRCLSTLDLVGLGVSGTMGVTTYILTGQVAMETAGPAIVVCFLVASLAAGVSGLCYAEFTARVPRAGSAYEYSYVTMGELVAFCVGWDLVLEKSVVGALMARSLSAYLDYALDHRLHQLFQRVLPLHVSGLSPYADIFAMGTVLVFTGVVALGVKLSTKVSNAITLVNMIVLSLVIVVGFFKVDVHNWTLGEDELPANMTAGRGGFVPFGLSGVWRGSAICFNAFIGFETVATLGEEAENPRWSIPVSLLVTLLVVAVYNAGVAAVVTLMCPYYLVDPTAPLSFIFDHVGLSGMTHVVSVGALCGIMASLMAVMYPSSRALYAMASDGLMFRCLAYVHPRFKTPLPATVLMGALAGLWAVLLTLSDLLYMVVVGSLATYSVIAMGLLVLRYQIDDVVTATAPDENISSDPRNGESGKTSDSVDAGFKLRDLINPRSGTPTPVTSRIANWCIVLMCVLLTVLCVFVTACDTCLTAGTGWGVAVVATLALLALTCLLLLGRQPQNTHSHLYFRVPGVPVVPALSFLVNIYLVCGMRIITWLRLVVWMVVGVCIYCFYGLRHSRLNVFPEEKRTLLDTS